MITLDYTDEFRITSDLLERDIVKTINGVVAVNENTWRIPSAFPCVAEAVLVIKESGGETTPHARQMLGHLMADFSHGVHIESKLGTVDLFDEQIRDAQVLTERGSSLVFNQMRTGKTYTTLAAVSTLNAFPLLVACKPANIGEWERQIQAALPDKSVLSITSGMTGARRGKLLAESGSHDIVIIGHNLLEKHSRLLSYGGLTVAQRVKEAEKKKYEPKELNEWAFKCVISDEAHRTSNPLAAVTRALWAIGDKAQHRFALTGTPAANGEEQLWGLLRFCWPDVFPAKSKWVNRYLLMKENQFGIRECIGFNPPTFQLWQKIFEGLHIRRERTRGPQKELRILPVEMASAQRKLSQTLVKECLAEHEGDILSATDAMSLHHALMQIACGIPVVGEDGKIAELKGPSSKMEAMISEIEDSEDKAIVVAEHKTVLKLARSYLEDNGISYSIFIGGMTKEQQDASKAAFNEGDAKVMLMSSAGAEGLDLPAARRTIFLERSYDYVISSQSEDRNVGPEQQAEIVEIIDICAKGTPDEDRYKMYVSKDTKQHEMLRDKRWIKRSVSL